MRRTDNGTEPTPALAPRSPQDGLLPELSLYEGLIDHGIAIADRRGDGIVDHVTARRLAIWFAARPQDPDFARSLVHFVDTGAISPTLKNQLRIRGRSPGRPDQPHASRLLAYCHARGSNLGWVGRNFGAACDQIDRADLMLADMHEQALQDRSDPAPAPEADSTQIIALAQANPDTRTVSLILDEATASTVLFAAAAHADEREAHVREVERYGQTLPEGSYGRRNRQAIAARETRIAARLRAVERAYRTAIERDSMFSPPEPPEHALPSMRLTERWSWNNTESIDPRAIVGDVAKAGVTPHYGEYVSREKRQLHPVRDRVFGVGRRLRGRRRRRSWRR